MVGMIKWSTDKVFCWEQYWYCNTFNKKCFRLWPI